MIIEDPTTEHLRLAASIVHVARDSRLVITKRSGREFAIGSQPADDATPCQFRRAAADPQAALVLSEGIRLIEFAGSIVSATGPVFHRHDDGRLQHWFITGLCPTRVEQVLHEVELSVPSDVVEVRLIVDSLLGYTVGCLTVDHPVFDCRAGNVALSVAARLEVEAVLDHVYRITSIEEES